MSCYSPWVKKGERGARPLSCGQCHGCRLERSRQWAVRCMHEASLSDSNCFITLTFATDCWSLDYSYFQLFMKRLRERFSSTRIRFYMCGEYGELNSRAHFHACLFGLDFPDKVYLSKTPSGSKLYRSAILESLWPYGFSSVGSVTFESAAYVARYVLKKFTGDGSLTLDSVIDPDSGEVFTRTKQFCRMSLKPGIGADWIRKFQSDVYPKGAVVVNGHEVLPPRYYDKLFEISHPSDFSKMKMRRHEEVMSGFWDSVPGRLSAKEQVSLARLSFLKRKI